MSTGSLTGSAVRIVESTSRPLTARCSTRRRARSAARVDLASVAEVDAAVAAAKAAFPAWRATDAVEARRGDVPPARAGRRRPPRRSRSLLTAEHGKVLVRRARRGRPRPREHRVRLRHPRTCSKGGFSEQASTGVDVYSHPPAARCRRRDHAVQLPGHGADVDVRQRASPAATRSCSSRARRTRRRRCSWPSLLPRPACPTACFNVVQGDKVAVDRMLEHPDVAARVASSARRRSPATSTRPAPPAASGCRRSAGRRTTWSCCPTPTSTWPPTPPSAPAYGSAGERCMAISRRAWRSATSADQLVGDDQASASADQGRRRAATRRRRWGR